MPRDPGRVYIAVKSGRAAVGKLEIYADFWDEIRLIVFGPVVRYGKPGEPMIQSTEATIDLGGKVQGTIQLSSWPAGGPPLPGDVPPRP
jgi:hypothetical protein